MLLSTLLLQYDSEGEDEDVREHQQTPSSSPPAAAVPPPTRPVTFPPAGPSPPSIPREKKRKRSVADPEAASDTLSFLSAPNATSAPSIPFPTAPSSSFSAIDDLSSILPPPKRDTSTARRLNTKSASLSSAQQPEPGTETSPAASRPAISASPPSAPPEPCPVPPPPGIRKRTAPPADTEPTATSPPPPSSTLSSTFLSLPPPRIAYTSTSPYSVQSHRSIPGPSPPSLSTPYPEPRMLRQFAAASEFIDVRVDDLTGPPAVAQAVPGSTAQAGEVKLRTTYWNAREGKEVVVQGVEGKQKRVHQINVLALQAKRQEGDILNARAHGSNTRRMARAKYGW